ncbi:MAG: DUF4157 domain-containing protein [Cyanobacteria bacterium P01_A01_bin.17]
MYIHPLSYTRTTSKYSHSHKYSHSQSVARARNQAHPLLQLQTQLGNRAVNRLLATGQSPFRARSIPKASSPQSEGQFIPSTVRHKMETAFGADFSEVRISEGATAAAMGAYAFTQGSQIHFAPGQYQPYSLAGQTLLGHELAHVVQQRMGQVNPTPTINTNPRLETEADYMGAKAARGQAVGQSYPSRPQPAGRLSPVQCKLGLEFETGWETYQYQQFNFFPPYTYPLAPLDWIVPNTWRSRVNLHKYDDIIESTTISGNGKPTWAMSTDEGAAASKIEFVLQPFDEIAGLPGLKTAMDEIKTLGDDLRQAANTSNQADFPVTDIANTAERARAQGFDDVMIKPSASLQANPQATGGVALNRVFNLFRSLEQYSQPQTTFHSESQDSMKTDFVVKKVNDYVQNNTRPVWDGLYPNSDPNNDMKGFLTLVLHYLVSTRTHPGQPSSAKGNFSVLARTDFVSMFNALAQKGKFQMNQNALTDLILEIWTPNQVTSGQDRLYKNGFDRNGQLDPGPKIGDWLEGITQGNDLMKFESFGTMGTDLISRTPNAIPTIDAAVLELRYVSHGADYTQWKDLAVQFFYFLSDVNALPNDTDVVRNTRLA